MGIVSRRVALVSKWRRGQAGPTRPEAGAEDAVPRLRTRGARVIDSHKRGQGLEARPYPRASREAMNALCRYGTAPRVAAHDASQSGGGPRDPWGRPCLGSGRRGDRRSGL